MKSAFRFYFAALWLLSASCADNQTIVWFQKGETVTLNCSQAEKNDEIRWFKGENVSGLHLAVGPTHAIKDLQESLNYSCTSSSPRIYRLFLLKQASPPELKSRTGLQNVSWSNCSENDDVPLDCGGAIVIVGPALSYTWYLGDKLILHHNNSQFIVQTTGRYLNEKFLCMAENYLGGVNVSFSIFLSNDTGNCPTTSPTCLYPPKFKSTFNSDGVIRVSEGGIFNQTYTFSGYFVLTYIALRRKNETGYYRPIQCCIYPGSSLDRCPYKFEGEPSGQCYLSCTFVISNVNESDEGVYDVSVANDYSNDDQLGTFRLDVRPPSVDSRTTYIVAGSTGGGVLVIGAVAVLLFLVNRKKKNQRHQKSRSMDRADYDYDFFIAFSEKDAKWVQTHLVDLMKNSPAYGGVTHCIHHSHFIPGGGIQGSIDHSLESCWKVVAVVSRSFLGSDTCKIELGKALDLGNCASALLVIDDDVGDLPQVIADVHERYNVYVGKGGEDAVTVDEKVQNALDTILSQAEKKERDVFFGFPDGADRKHRKAVKETLKSLNLSSISLPPSCPLQYLDCALIRCVKLTKKAVCLLSGASAKDFSSCLQRVMDGLKHSHEQYKLALVVCSDVDIDIDTGKLDCVKILVGEGGVDWVTQLQGFLCENNSSSDA